MSKLKNAMVRTRIENEVKNSVDEKLKRLGLDSPTVIRMLYYYIDNYNSVPFDLHVPNIPNKETLEVIKDIEEGKNLKKVGDINGLKKELGI